MVDCVCIEFDVNIFDTNTFHFPIKMRKNSPSNPVYRVFIIIFFFPAVNGPYRKISHFYYIPGNYNFFASSGTMSRYYYKRHLIIFLKKRTKRKWKKKKKMVLHRRKEDSSTWINFISSISFQHALIRK